MIRIPHKSRKIIAVTEIGMACMSLVEALAVSNLWGISFLRERDCVYSSSHIGSILVPLTGQRTVNARQRLVRADDIATGVRRTSKRRRLRSASPLKDGGHFEVATRRPRGQRNAPPFTRRRRHFNESANVVAVL